MTKEENFRIPVYFGDEPSDDDNPPDAYVPRETLQMAMCADGKEREYTEDEHGIATVITPGGHPVEGRVVDGTFKVLVNHHMAHKMWYPNPDKVVPLQKSISKSGGWVEAWKTELRDKKGKWTRRILSEGTMNGTVELLTSPSGKRAVSKFNNPDAEANNALAEAVADVLGVKYAHTYFTKEVDPTNKYGVGVKEYIEYVEGKPAVEWAAAPGPGVESTQQMDILDKLIWEGKFNDPQVKKYFGAHFDDIKKMALLDYLTGNDDRHSGNFIINDDRRVTAIDHDLAFSENNTPYRGPGRSAKAIAEEFTLEELEKLDKQLNALQGTFDKYHSEAWFLDMLANFQRIYQEREQLDYEK